MLYRTDDFARWGAGKGTNLEPIEIDANFWELAQRLVAVEAAAGEAANGIASIGVVGSQMTVYLEDGTALGPYTLPTAMIHYRGDWTAATAYNEMDLVAVPDTGLYLVLGDHTSGATFDALAEDAEGDPLYRWLFPMEETTGGPGVLPVEAIDGTAYTQVAGDNLKFKRTTDASAVTITIDADVNVATDEITFEQGGAGQITFVAGTGMTLNSRGGALKSAGQYGVCGLKFLSATEATLFGDITA